MAGGLHAEFAIEAERDARSFVAQLGLSAREADIAVHNLATFPASVRSRGVFFHGLIRCIENTGERKKAEVVLEQAALSGRLVSFRAYPHREFYKLYYAVTRILYPRLPFAEGLREVAKTFFPIFRDSIVGKTISALMGDKPADVLPLLAKAYNMSVENNSHRFTAVSSNEALWHAQVEPVTWYPETFEGIVRGALPNEAGLEICVDAQSAAGELRDYVFRIRW